MLTEEQEATLRRDALLEDARYRTPRGQWFDADIEQIWCANQDRNSNRVVIAQRAAEEESR